jgi:hypothetical protein
VLHAASQDLACLAEVGLVPTRVFDTELAGRLAGFERVGLGAMVERVLGLRLEKGHSAADWSTRPLPEAWLVYAALDVEVLVELRDRLEAELREQGKLELAHEEFEAVRLAPVPGPRVEPWRRTSGIHRLRTRRQLAGVRALWEVRDAMAAPPRHRARPDPARRRDRRRRAGRPADARPRCRRCPSSAAAPPGATSTRGSAPCRRPARCRRPTCRCRCPSATARRRPTAGPSATRWRPSGSPASAPS